MLKNSSVILVQLILKCPASHWLWVPKRLPHASKAVKCKEELRSIKPQVFKSSLTKPNSNLNYLILSYPKRKIPKQAQELLFENFGVITFLNSRKQGHDA